MKQLFKNYESLSGCPSIVRFLKFAQVNFSKGNYNKILKKYEEFKEFTELNDFRIKNNYLNFRDFCLLIKTN